MDSDEDFQPSSLKKRPLSQTNKSPKKRNKKSVKAVSPLKKWIDSGKREDGVGTDKENKPIEKIEEDVIILEKEEKKNEREMDRSKDDSPQDSLTECPICGADIRLMDYQVSSFHWMKLS